MNNFSMIGKLLSTLATENGNAFSVGGGISKIYLDRHAKKKITLIFIDYCIATPKQSLIAH
ncbi:hypothetical protein [Marinagarivorans algicola]|uniref:hypothetical protein n=1 Tax=Marinagarivorans algicola TaxID=1513270 RepID=UPI0006B8FE47|nr:hypothetical protein [Marinagarivorans algicola]